MKIPKEFKIANTKIIVQVVDQVTGRDGEEVYGNYNSVTNTIKIARTIDGITLKDEQLFNTFWHEVFHAFQQFFDNKYYEAEAQCYANFMREFQDSAVHE